MSDILVLNQAIGEAYGLSQVAGDGPAAVERLRQCLEEPGMRPLIEQRHGELAAVVAARTIGGRCGCHISKITHDLLTEALRS